MRKFLVALEDLYAPQVKDFEYPEFEGYDLDGLGFASARMPEAVDHWFAELMKQQPAEGMDDWQASRGGRFHRYAQRFRGVDKTQFRTSFLTAEDFMDKPLNEWDEEGATERVMHAPLYILGWYATRVFPVFAPVDEAVDTGDIYSPGEREILVDRRSVINALQYRMDQFEMVRRREA